MILQMLLCIMYSHFTAQQKLPVSPSTFLLKLPTEIQLGYHSNDSSSVPGNQDVHDVLGVRHHGMPGHTAADGRSGRTVSGGEREREGLPRQLRTPTPIPMHCGARVNTQSLADGTGKAMKVLTLLQQLRLWPLKRPGINY